MYCCNYVVLGVLVLVGIPWLKLLWFALSSFFPVAMRYLGLLLHTGRI